VIPRLPRLSKKGFEVIDIAIEEEWVAIAAKLK